MNRILALLLSLMLMLSCAGIALAEDASIYPLVDEPITVTALTTKDLSATSGSFATYDMLAELTGIKLEFISIDSEQLPVFLAAGQWPDVIINVLTNSQINDYGILGQKLVNYMDYLEYMPHMEKTMEEYPLVKNAMLQSDGGMYQLFRVENVATAVSARMHFREDVLTAAGQQVPATVDEFYAVLKAIYEYTGYSPMADLPAQVMFHLFPAFGEYVHYDFDTNDDGSVVYSRTTDQYRRFISFLNKLYEEKLLHPEYLTLDNATKKAKVLAGETVFGYYGFGSLTEEHFSDNQYHLGTMAPLTSEWNDAPQFYNKDSVPRPYGWAINAASPYVKEICQYLDIAFATEEVAPGTGLYSAAFWYGPENVSWKWLNDEHTEYDYILPEDFTGTSSAYIDQYMRLSYVGRNDVWAGAISAGENNTHYRQLGFVKNVIPYTATEFVPVDALVFLEDEQSVLDDKYVTIKTYVNEMQSKFIAGVEDVDDDAAWAKYCATIEDMGAEDVLEVYQAAYDRWNGK